MHSGWDHSSFKNYEFQVSHDGGNTYQTFYSGVGVDQDCCSWQEISLRSPASGKDFRLYMIDNWGGGWLSIEQMEFYTGSSKQTKYLFCFI